MVKALLGKKIDQSQTFNKNGKRIPVTRLQAGPCWIVDLTDHGTCQLAYGFTRRQKKPMIGTLKKAGLEEKKPRFFREVKLEKEHSLEKGAAVTVADVFSVGDHVRVVGTSKGKGFAGGVKRYGFAGGPRTHGQSDRERAPGSIGQSATPGRVYKGKRMAGRLGGKRVTMRGLKVMEVDTQNNEIVVSGLVPGSKNGFIIIERESARQEKAE